MIVTEFKRNLHGSLNRYVMSKYNFLLVEKSPEVQLSLKNHLLELGYTNIDTVASEDEAISLIQENTYHVIFCGIRLDYFTLKNAVEEERLNAFVALITEEDGEIHPQELENFHAYYSTTSNINDLKICIAVANYQAQKQKLSIASANTGNYKVKDAFYLKFKSRYKKIPSSDILYIEALKDYVVINTVKERYTLHSTMKDLERKLPEETFARIHRSFIVNLHKIEQLDYSELSLSDCNKEIPIGGSYREQLQEKLQIL